MPRASFLPLAGLLLTGFTAGSSFAQEVITSGTYFQDFNSIGSGLPNGWSGRTGANAGSLGTAQTPTTTATDWGSTTGRFANFASNNIASTSTAVEQSADLDRAFGVRQTAQFGDPGAALTFNFSTINVDLQSISFDLMTLSNQPRVTTWTIQYGIGVSPTTFADLGTYVSGTFESTTFTFDTLSNAADLAAMSNQTSVWFRVVTLTMSGSSSNRDTTGIDNFTIAATEASGGSELYWDGGSWTSTGPGTGGSGSWSDGSGGWDASNKAVFAGTGGTVNIGTVTADAGLEFASDDYTLSGGTLTLGNAFVSVADEVSATIESTIAGASGLTLIDGGTLVLTGSNTFTGNITISASTLTISGDENLGDSNNGIVLGGGTLDTVGSVTLGAGRSITGSGSVAVQSGNTLTIDGFVNAGISIGGGGNVVLTGFSNILTSLGFTSSGTFASSSTVSLAGDVTSSQTTGQAVVATNLDLGNALRVFNVGDGAAAVDFLVDGNLSGGSSARLHKIGAGTLRLAGDNSGLLAGVRLGTANGATGGQLNVVNNTSLGGGTFQFNHGTLFAENAVDFAIPVSIGGLVSAPAVIDGANVSFTGSSSFFTTVGQRNAMKVNNTTTINGAFTHSGTAGTGFDLGGTGTLVVNADASGFLGNTNVQDTVTLVVNSTWTGDISIEEDAFLEGVGSAVGMVTVSGGFTPGNEGVGVFTAGNLTLNSTALTTMSLQGSGLRGTDYSAVNVSGILTYGGDLVLDLSGGDYTASANLFDFSSFAGGFLSVSLVGVYGTLSLTDLDADGIWTGSDVTNTFTFNANDGTFALAPVPESSTMALVGLGTGVFMWAVRRKKATA